MGGGVRGMVDVYLLRYIFMVPDANFSGGVAVPRSSGANGARSNARSGNFYLILATIHEELKSLTDLSLM